VEAPDFVGAIVRAEPRADAPVVDLRVQPLGIVIRRRDRTDRLARRLIALLTQHREERSAATLDPDPRHLAPLRTHRFADDRNVVLRIAGDDAGVAAGAGVE